METPRQSLSIGGLGLSSERRRHLLAALSFLLALKALLFLLRASHAVLYPFEWSTMDGYYIYHGLRLISGQPIYFGYNSIVTPFEYVPLYPAVIGVFAKIFGPGVWYERLFGLVCAATIASLIYRAVLRMTANRLASLSSGLMFFAPASLSVWFLVRGIDIFAVLLALAGVSVAAAKEEPAKHRLVWSTILLILAFYTKQTTLFPAAGLVAYYLANRDLKRGLGVGLGFTLGAGSIFLLFQHLSGSWFFENAFVTTSTNPYYPWLLREYLADFSLVLFVAFPVAFVQALRGFRRSGVWTFYFFFTLLSALLAGKAGAALSYFIPLFTAVCIEAGAWLGDGGLFERRPRLYAAVLFLFLIQSLSFFAGRIPAPTKENYQQAEALDTQIKAHPGPLLIERIDSLAVMNGRELNVEAVQLPILIMRRKFDPDILIGPLQKKEFSLVVYSGIYFGGIPSIKRAIFENYQVIDRVRIGCFYGETTFLVLAPA